MSEPYRRVEPERLRELYGHWSALKQAALRLGHDGASMRTAVYRVGLIEQIANERGIDLTVGVEK